MRQVARKKINTGAALLTTSTTLLALIYIFNTAIPRGIRGWKCLMITKLNIARKCWINDIKWLKKKKEKKITKVKKTHAYQTITSIFKPFHDEKFFPLHLHIQNKILEIISKKRPYVFSRTKKRTYQIKYVRMYMVYTYMKYYYTKLKEKKKQLWFCQRNVAFVILETSGNDIISRIKKASVRITLDYIRFN